LTEHDMVKTVYVRELQALLDSVRETEAGRLPIDELQHRLYDAEHAITLDEERGFRSALRQAENRLERIRFTVLPENILPEARLVVAELKALLEELLKP
jgi:hypothetical protein